MNTGCIAGNSGGHDGRQRKNSAGERDGTGGLSPWTDPGAIARKIIRTSPVRPGLAAAAIATLLALTHPAAATTATFNFDADTLGTATPFADTNNGITATFSSPADPGGFEVVPTFFSTLTGNVLLDPGPAGADNIPLDIAFSQSIKSISFLFALNDPSNTTSMLFSTNAGGSTSATGTIPAGGFTFPEGSLSFSGAPFTSVVLSSGAFDFAVDDIVVSTSSSVPEPGSLSLRAAGLAGLGLMRRRCAARHG